MIRLATLTDKAAVIRLLKDSRDGAGFTSPDGPTGFSFEFDAAYAERLFLAHIGRPRLCCIINNVDSVAQGVLMAAAFEHPFGPVRLAKETLWWIDPAHRGTAAVRMLDAYETWAKSQGCMFVGMAGMGADPDVARLYRRRGYRDAEVHFLKAL